MAIEGIQASGQAGVFGGSINPVAYLMQQQAAQQRKQADVEKYQREQRDKLMDYNEKYNPSSKFAEFNYRIAERANNEIRNFTTQALDAGVPTSAIENERQRRIGVLNAYTKEVDEWKATIDDLDKTLKEGQAKGIYTKDATRRLRDIYLNADGSLKDDGSVRQSINTAEELFNDPSILNKDGAILNWVNNLKEQGRAVYSTRLNDGYTPDDVENIVTSKLQYERNQDGTLKPGPDGSPIPIIDDNTFMWAKMDPNLKILMQANGKTEKEQKEWLSQNIPGGVDSIKQKRDITSGKKIDKQDQWSIGGFSGRIDPKRVINRFENNEAIVNGFRPDILANTFSPFEDQEVFYTDANGNEISRAEGDQYLDSKGKPVGKPSKIRVAFNAKVNPYAIQGIMMDTSLSDEEKQQALAESMKSGGAVTRDFDITREKGRRQAHEALNRILDEYLPLKDRYSEDYTMLVRQKYEKEKKSIPGIPEWTEGKAIPGFSN